MGVELSTENFLRGGVGLGGISGRMASLIRPGYRHAIELRHVINVSIAFISKQQCTTVYSGVSSVELYWHRSNCSERLAS